MGEVQLVGQLPCLAQGLGQQQGLVAQFLALHFQAQADQRLAHVATARIAG
ncbi:hypothetical protein D9M72_269780 [compost metagenome]